MKRILSMLLSVLFVGCVASNDSNGAIETVVGIPEQIVASFEQPTSRTMVQEDRYIFWTEGDEISFFPQLKLNLQYRLHSAEGETAYFTRISTPESSDVKLKYNYAVYPYAADVDVTKDGEILLQLPSLQHYAKESLQSRMRQMVQL